MGKWKKQYNAMVERYNSLLGSYNQMADYNKNLNTSMKKREKYWSSELKRAGKEGQQALRTQGTRLSSQYAAQARRVSAQRKHSAAISGQQETRALKQKKSAVLRSTLVGGRAAGAESRPTKVTSVRPKYGKRRGRQVSRRTSRRSSRPS